MNLVEECNTNMGDRTWKALSPADNGRFPLMAAPSSAQPETHEPGLDLFWSLGGSLLHLHGEGGETHSRSAVGAWLKRTGLRSEFALCSQICHDDWDENNQRPVVRFTPDGVAADIEEDLCLIGCSELDIVYLDDHAELPFEPVVEALAAEISAQRIRHVGVRNWRPDRLKALCAYARNELPRGVQAMITTELGLPKASSPLWPEYVPFDDEITEIVRNEGIVVYAHAGDNAAGQCLFGDEDAFARLRAHWVERWQMSANEQIVQDVIARAARFQTTPRAVLLTWMLSRPFSVVPIVGLPELLAHHKDYRFAVEHSAAIWEA